MYLLSRCSRQRERRLNAMGLSICLLVCLSVWKNAIFSKTKQFRAMMSINDLWSRAWAFQRTHYWTPKIQDGGDPPSWKLIWRHFFCRGRSGLDKISQTGAEWHVVCGDMVKIETSSRIPTWRTFGRIQWHVIPEPRATLKGVRIPSAILKIVFRRIIFFCFLNAIWLWWAAAFVLSSIHLFYRATRIYA